MSLSNGHRSVLIAAEMQPGYQVDRYGARFDEFWTYRANAPEGISIETAFDQAGYTTDRLQGVAKNLLMGIALVLLVLLVTLGWRAALVVASSCPVHADVDDCPLLSQNSIQHMSVTGLVMAWPIG